jgi:hypothetical protein
MMAKTFRLSDHVDEVDFLGKAVAATRLQPLTELLKAIPIVDEQDYAFDRRLPDKGWQAGKLHWYPVGGDRGNAGRIKLAGNAENPIGERLINAMEGVIELQRQRELLTNPSAMCPTSPRDAVKRYFDLPPLDQLPNWPDLIRGEKPKKYARNVARLINVRLFREKKGEYTVVIRDQGIGQPPQQLHATLLSLGSSDKGDKPYLIGVFGQGGSSAYAASEMSWLLSRRAPELVNSEQDRGMGWTVVKHIFPKGRRDDYYAYLAASPDGAVPCFSASAADAVGIGHGTRLAHISYDFGKTEPAATLYSSLNHLLFNPVLPYELSTRPDGAVDLMSGNAYRLSNLPSAEKSLDKRFEPQPVIA